MLRTARTALVPVGGGPFGVAATPDGRFAFVAIADGGGGASVKVLRLNGSAAPTTLRSIRVTADAVGATVTSDGRYLLVADGGDGAAVLSVARAESGAPGAVLGTLRASRASDRQAAGGGAIEVTTSPDGRFAFVTVEGAQRAAVYNLAEAVAHRFKGGSFYVGAIPLGAAPVGITVSPDGHWLYATSEVGLVHGKVPAMPAPSLRPAQPGRKLRLSAPGTVQEPHGTLTLVDLSKAETDPARSVVATVDAGCEPVRVVTSDGGAMVWVTARASDDLLGFAAARLVTDPSRALVSVTRVGEAPVGLAAVAEGSLIVVADSNRFGAPGAHADLAVVNVAEVLAAGGGRSALAGRLPAGMFPRDMSLSPDGTLLVSNFASGQLELVAIETLPRATR
jgi:DNA-binding beta-propeller fold protein YncE